MRPRSLLFALLALVQCGYRPATFRDTAPITVLSDQSAIPIPAALPDPSEAQLSDAHWQRALVDALDPWPADEALDVNALDDVPRSSWFAGKQPDFASWHEPLAPYEVVADQAVDPSHLRVRDARGDTYELIADGPNHPEVRTAAAIVSSRLFASLGYRVAPVSITSVAPSELAAGGGLATRRDQFFERTRPPNRGARPGDAKGALRVAALRWPIGIDVGATRTSAPREDDPNDWIPAPRRRTLRALVAFAAWLKIPTLGSSELRDVYVGAPAQGHLEHFLRGLDGSLGAEEVSPSAKMSGGEKGKRLANPFFELVTLGLTTKPVERARAEGKGLGAFPASVAREDFGVRPKLEPFDRAAPSDLYWAAKRMASLDEEVIRAAVDAGKLSDASARDRLIHLLKTRRRDVARLAMDQVTPCEVDRAEPGKLVLRDVSLAEELSDAATSRYGVDYLDEDGDDVAPSTVITAEGPHVDVPLPDMARWAPGSYLVVRVKVHRRDRAAPRALEVHLRGPSAGGTREPRVVGVRH